MTYKLGSLFDGSGGFPLAGSLCGITPAWASEVEPYPIAVTRSRFPDMKHLGDISKINGAEVEPVDIITFGSPCQDLSVAGKRAGLKHEANGDDETTRSGLFMEAVRIIKEMRRATNGRYPQFALWENVPGAFSSNKGEDFRIVCEELIKIVEPKAVMPAVPKNGWPYADSYCGDGWSLAYRVFDAQYWGVPQRRRRIHLVLDLRGERAREVLFEREGVRGYFAQSGTPWQAAAAHAENCSGADDREISKLILDDQGGSQITIRTDGKSPTLRAEMHGNVPCVLESGGFCPEQSAKTRGIGWEEEMAPTLRAGVVPGVVTLEPGIAAREGGHIYEGVCGTLRAEAGDNRMAVAYSFDSLASNSMKSKNPHSGCRQVEVAKTLDTTDPNPCKNQGGIAIVCKTYDARGNGDGDTVSTLTGDHENRITDYTSEVVEEQPVYCLQGNGIDRADTAGCNGKGWKEDVCYTLNTIDRPAVVHLASGKETVGTLMANAGTKLWLGNQEAFSGDYHIVEERDTPVRYIVRRLTPTECARLQGFPDKWGHPEQKETFSEEEYRFWLEVRNTHATVIGGREAKEYTKEQMLKWYNGLHTDSAEYKMWGNGIALPPALYCMQGIRDALDECEVTPLQTPDPAADVPAEVVEEPTVIDEPEVVEEPKVIDEVIPETKRELTKSELISAYAKVYRHRKYLTRQQIRTLKGQIQNGDVEGAMRGLKKLLKREGL